MCFYQHRVCRPQVLIWSDPVREQRVTGAGLQYIAESQALLCAQDLHAPNGRALPAWRALCVLAQYRTTRNLMSLAYIFSRIGTRRHC